MKTYKGTDKNLRCRDYQYEIGKLNEAEGAICCGEVGFHSCEAPFDVLRYYGLNDGNRFFECEADGIVSWNYAKDSKLASSKLTLKAEIGFPKLLNAQVEYTRKKADDGTSRGDRSYLAGGYGSNLAGGYGSNLSGGNMSNLAGGGDSNLIGGYGSNLAGGNGSILVGGRDSNLVGGYRSTLIGDDESILVGKENSTFVGGNRSIIAGRNKCKAKAGKNSILCLSEWDWVNGTYIPISVKAVIVDGDIIKANTWYQLQNGEFVEAKED